MKRRRRECQEERGRMEKDLHAHMFPIVVRPARAKQRPI